MSTIMNLQEAVCPHCGSQEIAVDITGIVELHNDGSWDFTGGQEDETGEYVCRECDHEWPIKAGAVPAVKVYSITAIYNPNDMEQGTFGEGFMAISAEDAERQCRAVMAENSGNSPETAEIIDITEGVNVGRAGDMLAALKHVAEIMSDPYQASVTPGDWERAAKVVEDTIAAAERS